MLDALFDISGVFVFVVLFVGIPCVYFSGVRYIPAGAIRPGTEHVCAGCRYDLSGLPSSARCPECGGVQRGLRPTDWLSFPAVRQFDSRAMIRSSMLLLVAFVAALLGPLALNLVWAGLYWWEGWPDSIVENLGRAGLRDHMALIATGMYYLAAAVLVMPFITGRSRRTYVLAAAGTMATVLAIQILILLGGWLQGSRLLKDAIYNPGGPPLSVLPLILGLLISFARTGMRRKQAA